MATNEHINENTGADDGQGVGDRIHKVEKVELSPWGFPVGSIMDRWAQADEGALEFTRADLENDSHGARYLKGLDKHPEARDRVFAIFNDWENVNRLTDAQALGRTALSGIARFIENDPVIEPVLVDNYRFRQAIGVMTKLYMAKRGWRLAGRSGPVYGARYFTRTEHYEQAPFEGWVSEEGPADDV